MQPEEHLPVVARSGVVRDAHNQVASNVEVRHDKPEGDLDQEAEAAHLHNRTNKFTELREQTSRPR